MSRDKGLNWDLDRLPVLIWIVFLKFLDDPEHCREGGIMFGGKKLKPPFESPSAPCGPPPWGRSGNVG